MQTTFPISNSLRLDINLFTFLAFAILVISHSSCKKYQRTKSSWLKERINVEGIILLLIFLSLYISQVSYLFITGLGFFFSP